MVGTYITLDNVRILRELNESEKEHKDSVVSPVIDAKNWPKTMEIFEEYLRGYIVVKGVPISYVVRFKEAVAPSLDEPEMSFLSFKDDMVAHAPIIEGALSTVTSKTFIMKFWGLIYVITRDLYFWTYVKSSQRTREGRKFYRDLWDHFLVPDNVDNMSSEVERLLIATHYSGERKQFNF